MHGGEGRKPALSSWLARFFELLRNSIASQIRSARLAIVDCGHEIPLERPHELAALIEAFLAALA